MMSKKMEHVLDNLSRHYMPFTLLSPERLSEVVSVVRFVELREGEILQIRGGKANDYLYVVEGQLEVIQCGSVRSFCGPQDTRSRPFILPSEPNTATILARQDSIICHADREMLDNLIAWDEVVHLSEETDAELHERLELVRNSLVFRRLPLEVVETAFKRMEVVEVKAGENIITMGEDGDAYYIIHKGTAETYQMGLYDDQPVKVAELGEGDAFGCEALISGNKRCETVVASSDCTLLALNHEVFDEIIRNPLIKTVHPSVARTMVETGYKLIDVRYAEEFDDHHIPGAILIPLYELRNRMDELDPNERYIVYCHAGGRSAVATLILAQNQFDVVSLEGGIRDWPFETVSIEEEAPPPQAAIA
ncbi:cyclic nucleotide-binding domain-containing protein [Thiohalobacter sp. IOR34]|uniref:cyclic nucleotide-binding domain-containing protein n=1 Tax=Thiohalobacter sp. IOR34 TaxID=3057176 RepID=UPI0025B0AA25|nr:cyclic nucleotide-binding domain-containing protein [Thiohalobacter sp. IOR34]WJW74978.1 cyclic nucleotide-binding domain-containing protein [Thiohalobacter sp. IOR34]